MTVPFFLLFVAIVGFLNIMLYLENNHRKLAERTCRRYRELFDVLLGQHGEIVHTLLPGLKRAGINVDVENHDKHHAQALAEVKRLRGEAEVLAKVRQAVVEAASPEMKYNWFAYTSSKK